MWGLATAYFCFTYTWWLFLNWLPTYLVQVRGYTTIKMGFFASLPWLAALISTNGAGWLSDALVKRGFSTGSARRTLIYAGAPAMAVCLWFVTQAGNAEVAVGLITATISLAGMNLPAFWSLPMDMNMRKAGFITGLDEYGKRACLHRGAGRDRLCGHVVWLDGRPRARVGPCLALRNSHVPHVAETHIKTAQDVKILVVTQEFKVFKKSFSSNFDRVNFSVAAPTIMRLFHWDDGHPGTGHVHVRSRVYPHRRFPQDSWHRFGGRKGSRSWEVWDGPFFHGIDAVCRHSAPHVSGQGTAGPGPKALNFPGSTSVL